VSKWKGGVKYENHPAVIDHPNSKIANKDINERTADGKSTYLIGVDH